MKLFHKAHTLQKPRPYWHVDAKWVLAILLTIMAAVTLPIVAAYYLTSEGPATKLISYAMAGLTSPQGIDSEEGLKELRAETLAKGSKTITFGGVDVTLTVEDVTTLSPRELRLKVFGAFATRFYHQGAEGIARSQGASAESTETLKKDASLISVFGKEVHDQVGMALVWVALIDLLLLAGVVFFSHRFGRLVSPGIVLLLVGLPGILFGAIASQNPEVVGAAREQNPADIAAMIGTFISYIGPLIVPYFASVYLFALVSGVGLLLLAGVAKLVYMFIHRKKDMPASTYRDALR